MIKMRDNRKDKDDQKSIKREYQYDLAIIGGLGHVGLPLGIVFAHKGLETCLIDIDKEKVAQVQRGNMPFIEYDAEQLLKEVLANKKLSISLEQKTVAQARNVVIAIGTPIDEHLNPKTRQFLETLEQFKPYLNPKQTIIVRSTVYPNTCNQLQRMLKKGNDLEWKIAYCPERTVQGYAVRELTELPQIVSGLSNEAVDRAVVLFQKISPKIIKTSIKEAELTKLFSNVYRYIQFALTNEFYMISHKFEVDYDKIRKVMTEGYERIVNLPSPGFAAGPCLLKDTMQLAAFDPQGFQLGKVAMDINEGLPNFMIENLRREYDLEKSVVGILGMAFKANIDDIRDSLSFKLGKILRRHGSTVYYSDEFAQNPDFVSKEELIDRSDIVIIGVPHTAYNGLSIPQPKKVIDLWGVTKKNLSNHG